MLAFFGSGFDFFLQGDRGIFIDGIDLEGVGAEVVELLAGDPDEGKEILIGLLGFDMFVAAQFFLVFPFISETEFFEKDATVATFLPINNAIILFFELGVAL